MSWLDRVSIAPVQEPTHKGGAGMGPGITGQYDQNLREKAGMHKPPPAPEHMGVEGEYDPSGLVKRIAIALDNDPAIGDIESLHLIQRGSTISLEGQIPDQATLDHIIRVAGQVDGTRAVETEDVTIGGIPQ